MTTLQVLILVVGALGGALGGTFLFQGGSKAAEEKLHRETHDILSKSKEEAKEIAHAAKEGLEKIKQEAHEENQRLEAHVERLKESFSLKEKHVNNKLSANGQFQKSVDDDEAAIKDTFLK